MNVHVLDIRFSSRGRESLLHPVLLECDRSLILVDCGYPGFTTFLEHAANVHGFSLKQLTAVIITHHDIDHYGCLFELKTLNPALRVYSSVLDEPYISGREKSIRLKQAEEMYESLEENQKPGAVQFQEALRNIRPVAVDKTLEDGEEISSCAGVQVVSTPGHMPGHISLYVRQSKTLIAADAVVFENGKLSIANPDFTLDLKSAVTSIKKLQQLEIDRIICYHGGIVTGDIEKRLEQLAEEYAHL